MIKPHHLTSLCCYLLLAVNLASCASLHYVEANLNQTRSLKQSRIVGSAAANSGEAGFHVEIYQDGILKCNGAFVGPRFVLTTAYCVQAYENQPGLFQVHYGSLLRTSQLRIPVSRIVAHEQFSSSTMANDIALLELSYRLSPGTNSAVLRLTDIEPIPLTTHMSYAFAYLLVSNTYAYRLGRALQSIASNEECQAKWNIPKDTMSTVICASYPGQSPCTGDSGAPLVRNGVLFGIYSWGPSTCPDSTRPNVYTNIAHFKTWIEQNGNASPL